MCPDEVLAQARLLHAFFNQRFKCGHTTGYPPGHRIVEIPRPPEKG